MRYSIPAAFVLLLAIPVAAEESGLEGVNEFPKALGSFALFLLAAGSAYVILRRLFVWSRNWQEEEIKNQIMTYYKQFRKPLLLFHNIIMVVATIVGGIHGLLLLNSEYRVAVYSGVAAVVVMLILCASGIFMFFKFRPVWTKDATKGLVKYVHRQWLFSGILIITLLIHLATGGE